MNEFGFCLDSLPGNMIVVMAQLPKAQLLESGLCPNDYHINDDQDEWLVISPTGQYDPEFYGALAQNISQQLNCRTIKYEFYDGTGHQDFSVFMQRKKRVGYCYGEFDDEMAEFMGERVAKEHETLINKDDVEYIYFSTAPHPDEATITLGQPLLNALFVKLNARLAWDYLPQS